MKTSNRRYTLLTGASISALGITGLGLASPALAAPHDTVTPGTYAGTNVTDNTAPVDSDIVICDIATASPECFLGVLATGTGVVSATVNSTANGQIELIGVGGANAVDIAVLNPAGDSAEIGAVAIASESVGGLASANAQLTAAISVMGTGAAAVNVAVINDGTLLVDALAQASGNNAIADADVDTAIYLNANSTGGNAATALTNSSTGVLTVEARAQAVAQILGGTNADAFASLQTGISQDATAAGAFNASNTLTNDGTMTVGAFATATAKSGSGFASAQASQNIDQEARALGDR